MRRAAAGLSPLIDASIYYFLAVLQTLAPFRRWLPRRSRIIDTKR